MSLLSVNDWQEFLYHVGENFYDLVHGADESNNEFTKVSYPYAISYNGCCTVPVGFGSSYSDNLHTATCYFSLDNMSNVVLSDFVLDSDISNYTGFYAAQDYNDIDSFLLDVSCLNSFVGTSLNNRPYWVGSDNIVYKQDESNIYQSHIFIYDMTYKWFIDNQHTTLGTDHKSGNTTLKLNSDYVNRYLNYNNYDIYYDRLPKSILNSSREYNGETPSILSESPVLINTTQFNTNSSVSINIKNNYINNGDTITNYTYNIDNNNYITVNYSVDSNDVPSGYIDIQPTGNISFDDLFDMFNTILAPLVGVGLDLPDWNDYLPPVVTGDVNVNIDLPNVTGVYPAETITPIDSDVYNIMSIDSMPQLPSLTGIDNGQAGAALGSSFTFLDGCGLLMPFVTLAIVRLLISKFRGDS